jgi:CheY-like chemotaxis protein
MDVSLKRVLLVEDNPGDVRLFQEAIRQSGRRIELSVAEDGDTALRMFPRVAPHLIVLDLNMPGMDGHSLLETLKGTEATNMVPVVVFSSSENPADVKQSYERGANCFLRKPLDLQSMLQMLGEFCRVWLGIALLPDPPPPARTARPHA